MTMEEKNALYIQHIYMTYSIYSKRCKVPYRKGTLKSIHTSAHLCIRNTVRIKETSGLLATAGMNWPEQSKWEQIMQEKAT